MNWTDLSHFLVLMRTGTLRAAGKELGVAATTVARRVASLEADLRTPLFERRGKGSTPTEAAHTLAAMGREMEDRVQALERQVAPASSTVSGNVRVSATETVAAELVAPAVAALFARHPQIALTLRVDAHVASFTRNETELALRLLKPVGNQLVVKKVAKFALGLYAQRSYLAQRGRRTLAQERFLTYDDSYGRIPELRWFEAHKLSESIAFRTASTRALHQATLAGVGIGLLPTFLAARTPELVRIELPGPIPPRPIYLVTHETLRKRPAVAAVFEHLVESLGSMPELR